MARRSKFRWFKWLVILAVVSAGGYFAWLRFRAAGPEEAPQVTSTTIKLGSIVQSVTASGTLNPLLNVQVGSQISGQIRKLHVDFNSRVKAGDIVAELDGATYETRLLQNEADLSSAKAGLQLAEINARRAQELFDAKLISQAEYDTTMANLTQAKAQVQTRESQVNSTKVDIARCTIIAPIDGIVIDRKVDVGQTVAASMNAPVLFMIANDLRSMQINASVAEADIGSVDTNQTVKFTVDAFPGRDFVGKVVQVRNAPQTVQNVVSYDTIIDVDNRDEKLKPGMTANVQIITAERKDVVVVPNSALRFKPPEGLQVQQPAGALAPEGTTKAAPGALPETPEALLAKMREYRDKGETAPDELRAKLREMIQAGKIDPAQAFGGGGAGGPRGAGGPGGPGGPGAGGAGGARGSRSGGGGAPKKAGDRQTSYTLYVVINPGATTNSTPVILEARKVKTGITDGINTEVTEGLAAGDVVATGQVLARAAAAGSSAQRPTNPFSSGSRRGP